MGCSYCFGEFDDWDDYCYYLCPYSYECEDETYGYYDDYYDDDYYYDGYGYY